MKGQTSVIPVKKPKFFQILVQRMQKFMALDVEISLASGIIFTKIGLANGAILKLWAAQPT